MVDALKTYKAKRNFALTSEPADGGEASADGLSFVIQKHWASRLHYDFRLELDGAMKSWAVPKGPSYDSRDKRMAVHVEDHPISYSSFEGTIPEKQYGAGRVIIWDKGTWHPLEDAHKGYRDGNLKFELRGHKMHGKWVLVRMKGKGEKKEPWLLIKEKDAFTRPAAEFSVIDEMPDSVKSLKLPKAAKPKAAKASTRKQGGMPEGAVKAALPQTFSPQLATLVKQAPADAENWLFEVKFDGYRMLARIDGRDIRLFTRAGNDWTAKLQPLAKALGAMKLPPGWYDGEIVVAGQGGLPDFGALQQSFDNEKTGDIVYYLFDAPYHDGYDLRAAPLDARRAVLRAALAKAPSPQVHFSEEFDATPEEVVASACKLGLEGVIAKRRDAHYVSRRSPHWAKLKCGQRQEFVIGGYTDPQGGRAGFGSLLLGVYDNDGVLQYAGNVGTGFNDKTLRDLEAQLKKLETDTRPFPKTATILRRPHWVKPTLVAEVSFGEWTRSGSIRHAVFRGLRSDKKARDIVREKAVEVADTVAAAPAKAKKSASANSDAAAIGKLPADLKITHPDRVVDAASGITKIELVRYYALVAEQIMPHLKGRPVSLVRAPAGIGGELFFQKHAETRTLPGVRQLDPALYISHPPLLEIATKQGLLAAVQWNVTEFHTQNAPTSSLEFADRIVFDLDPGEGVQWQAVQEAAQLMHLFLEELGLTPFLKTSGGKGLHVVVPIRKSHDWDTVKGFTQAVVQQLAKAAPQRFVAKSGPKNRVGKIFIDYLRNGLGATTAAAWTARARPGLGISVPVGWDELASLKGGDHWNVKSVHTRLDRGNAPWDGYAKAARSLNGAMKALGYKPPGS